MWPGPRQPCAMEQLQSSSPGAGATCTSGRSCRQGCPQTPSYVGRTHFRFPPPPSYSPAYPSASEMSEEHLGSSSGPSTPRQPLEHVWQLPNDYSYAYYVPGPPTRHTNVPNRYPGNYRDGSYKTKHTYLTRYGTEENIYEEISEVAKARLRPSLHHHHHHHQESNMSIHQNLVAQEVRRVQNGHRRMLGELNLSVEAMLMPSSSRESSDDNDKEGENKDQLADLLTIGPTDDLLSPVPIIDLDSGFSGSSSGASYRSAAGSLRRGLERPKSVNSTGQRPRSSQKSFWGRNAWKKLAGFPSNLSVNKSKDDKTDTMEKFIISRGLPVNLIQKFEQENIDVKTILLMTENQLTEYVPKRGDRIALMDFCRRTCNPKKQALIEKIRKSRGGNESEDNLDEPSTSTGIKRKSKQTLGFKKKSRNVYLGWVHSDEAMKDYKYVRNDRGGGPRTALVPISNKKSDIIPIARKYFFPKGKSYFGLLEEFEENLVDFGKNAIDSDLSMAELFEITGATKLKLYYATRRIVDAKHKENRPSPSNNGPSTSGQSNHNHRKKVSHSKYVLSSDSENECSSVVGNNIKSSHESFNYTYSSEEANHPLIEILDYDALSTISNSLPDVILEGKVRINIHRGQVFDEFLQFHLNGIKIDQMQIVMVLPNGNEEAAEDMGGVMRDALSEFWATFYEKYTLGTNTRIPYVRHDFQRKDWQAIAEIIKMGYSMTQYFPIQLAASFMTSCLGKNPSDDDLLTDFLSFVSESERETLNEALKNFDAIDEGDLLDVISTFEGKYAPTNENLKGLLITLAHKEIIQKPAFVSECFLAVLKNFDFDLKFIYSAYTPSPKNIISKLKISEDYLILTSEQSKVFNFLKKLIREIDNEKRSNFLRFCTGSDIPTGEINISFLETEGFARSPVAHTCGRLLELPTSYENFVEFRSEFNNILISRIWIMDIV